MISLMDIHTPHNQIGVTHHIVRGGVAITQKVSRFASPFRPNDRMIHIGVPKILIS